MQSRPAPFFIYGAGQRPPRFLVVDDSATVRIYLRHQLLALHPLSEVLEAEDGKSAVRQLSTAAVDLVITDLSMPGMDGDSLIRLLKGNPLLRRKPILVVSGAPEAARNADWAAEPGLAVVGKPLTLASLDLALKSLLL